MNIRLSLYSIERLKRFHEEVGGESGLKQIGYLLLLISEPARWESYQKGVALQKSPGVASPHALALGMFALMPEVNPERSSGGNDCGEDGYCDPHGVATSYLAAALRRGVELRRAILGPRNS